MSHPREDVSVCCPPSSKWWWVGGALEPCTCGGCAYMCCDCPKGFRGALNWSPMMPRDGSLSDSCPSDRCFFLVYIYDIYVSQKIFEYASFLKYLSWKCFDNKYRKILANSHISKNDYFFDSNPSQNSISNNIFLLLSIWYIINISNWMIILDKYRSKWQQPTWVWRHRPPWLSRPLKTLGPECQAALRGC